jgi:hypothetical protein
MFSDRNHWNQTWNQNSAYNGGPRNWNQKSEFPTKTVKDNLYTNEYIHVLKISNLDLWVTNKKKPAIGLRLILPGQSCPVFIRLPRSKSLGIMSNGKNICAAMHSCAQTQPQSLSRGRRNHVCTDHDNKYYSVGAQPERAERGVQSGLYKMKHGFPNHQWDVR